MNYLRQRVGGSGGAPQENLENLGLLECISCILEQELGHLNRTGNTNRH